MGVISINFPFNSKQYFLFLQTIKSFKDSWWIILKPPSTPCSLVVAFSEFYIQKVIHFQICRPTCFLPSELQVCSVMLKWPESWNSWIRVFPGWKFYSMINQLLYIIVIIIRMDRHSAVYTRGSNLKTLFVILLSCSLQLLWCYLAVPLIWCVWTSR